MLKNKRKLRIKVDKLDKDQFQIGLFLNYWKGYGKYIYINFIKWNISIGWF